MISIVFISLIYLYRNDAIGSGVTVPTSIPRAYPHYPIIGSLLGAAETYDTFYDNLTGLAELMDWKPVLLSLPFANPMIVSHDPKNIEYVLKTRFENFVKGEPIYSRLGDVLGHGIFAADGEQWKIVRKTASHIFSTKAFKDFVETVFVDEMDALTLKLKDLSTTRQEFDLQDLFFRFTLDSFAYIGFGAHIRSMQNGKVPFADAFDRLQNMVDFRFFNPIWRITELFPSIYSQKQDDLKTIFNFGQRMVLERRQEALGEKKGSDLLSLFLNATNQHGKPYNDRELTEHVLNFIIAGRDTTAQALSWTFYYLALNPSKLDILVKEIDETLGEAEKPTYDQIKNMKYANAVFHEALRLSPSVPKNMKVALQDDVLPDGTPIPAGAGFVYSTYCMARWKKLWGEDAAQFNPERWLDGRVPSQFEYAVFNAGPRICLGKTFAELEGVFVLVSMLRLFKISVLEPEKVQYGNSLTLPMKSGLKCKVSLRQ